MNQHMVPCSFLALNRLLAESNYFQQAVLSLAESNSGNVRFRIL